MLCPALTGCLDPPAAMSFPLHADPRHPSGGAPWLPAGCFLCWGCGGRGGRGEHPSPVLPAVGLLVCQVTPFPLSLSPFRKDSVKALVPELFSKISD